MRAARFVWRAFLEPLVWGVVVVAMPLWLPPLVVGTFVVRHVRLAWQESAE